MGGITSTASDPGTLNLFNPASYAYLSRTSLQLSGKGGFQNVSNETGSGKFKAGQISELGIGLKKQGASWGLAIGLVPYSSVGYNLTSPASVNDSTHVNYKYDGSGGVNRLVLGYGRTIKLYKDPKVPPGLQGTARQSAEIAAKDRRDSLAVVKPRLAVGINLNYLFGSLRQESRVQFDNSRFFSTRTTSRTSVNDLTVDLGLHYFMPLHLKWEGRRVRKGTYLSVGADYMLGRDLNAKFEELGEMYLYSSGRETVIDTTFEIASSKGFISLPARLTTGFSILFAGQEGRSTIISAEYRTQNWSGFSTSFENILTANSLSAYNNIALGLERTPRNVEAASNILERTTYRLGVRSTSTYIRIREENIRQQAVSAGISIPILSSRSTSRFSLAVEYGNGGTTANGLLKENFLSVQAGFTLTPHFLNPWFVQRRYD